MVIMKRDRLERDRMHAGQVQTELGPGQWSRLEEYQCSRGITNRSHAVRKLISAALASNAVISLVPVDGRPASLLNVKITPEMYQSIMSLIGDNPRGKSGTIRSLIVHGLNLAEVEPGGDS